MRGTRGSRSERPCSAFANHGEGRAWPRAWCLSQAVVMSDARWALSDDSIADIARLCRTIDGRGGERFAGQPDDRPAFRAGMPGSSGAGIGALASDLTGTRWAAPDRVKAGGPRANRLATEDQGDDGWVSAVMAGTVTAAMWSSSSSS